MPQLYFDKRHSVTSILTAAVGQYRFVGFDGQHATQAGGARDAQGISEEAGVAGDAISLVTGYSHMVEAGGAIPVGAMVAPSTDGTGRAVVTSGANCGRAITAAAAAGEMIVVRFVEPGIVPQSAIALVSSAGILGTLVTDWSQGSIGVSGSTGTTAALDAGSMCGGLPMLRVTMGAAGTLTLTFTPTSTLTVAQLKTMQLPVKFERNATDDGSGSVLANPSLWLTGASSAQWRHGFLTTGWRDSATRTWSAPTGTTSQGWNFSGTGPPSSTASMDTDTIATLKLVFVVTSADVGKVFWLGAIRSGSRRKGRVSLTLDGAYISQKSYILPMLRAAGLRASLALVNQAVGSSASYMTWADVGNAYGDGHNVLHHTYDAAKTSGYVNASDWPTGASITADMQAGFADMAARGFSRGNYYGVWGYAVPWAYTVGKTRQDVVTNAVRASGVKAMRASAVSGGTYTRLQSIAHADYVDPLCVQGSIQISSTHVASDLTTAIDAARDRGEWAVITIHRSVVSAPGSLEMLNGDFDTWISYLAQEVRSGAIDCTPFDEVCSAVGVNAQA